MRDSWGAQAKAAVLAGVEAVLQGETFQLGQVPEWTRAVAAGCLEALRALDTPAAGAGDGAGDDGADGKVDGGAAPAAPKKLVVHAAIARKADAASLTMSSACLWDEQAGDCSACVRWENQSMHCVCTVYALHAS